MGTEGDRTILPLVRHRSAILLVSSRLLSSAARSPFHIRLNVWGVQCSSPLSYKGGGKQHTVGPLVPGHTDQFQTGHSIASSFPANLDCVREHIAQERTPLSCILMPTSSGPGDTNF